MNTTPNAFLRKTLSASACAALALVLGACSPEPQGRASPLGAAAAPAAGPSTSERASMPAPTFTQGSPAPTQQGSPATISRSPNSPRAAPLTSADQWRPDGARVLEPTISSKNAPASQSPQAYYPRQNGYGEAPADSWRAAQDPIGTAVNASDYPPPPLREYMGQTPGYGYQWIDGHWVWSQNDWAWSPGYWIAPPAPNRFWIAPRYERRSRMVFFVPGHWSNQAELPAYQGYAAREDRDSLRNDQDRRDWSVGRDGSLPASAPPQIQNGQAAWSNMPRRDGVPNVNSNAAAQTPGGQSATIAPALPLLAAPAPATANSASAAPANGPANSSYELRGRDLPPMAAPSLGSIIPSVASAPSMGVTAPAAPLAMPATALPNASSMGLAKPAPIIQAPPAASPATPISAERQDTRSKRPVRPIEAPRPPIPPTPPTPSPAAPPAPMPASIAAPAPAAQTPAPKPAPSPLPAAAPAPAPKPSLISAPTPTAPPAPIIAAPLPKPPASKPALSSAPAPAAPPTAPPAPIIAAPLPKPPPPSPPLAPTAPAPKPTPSLAPPPAPAATPSAPAGAPKNVRENRCAKPPCEAREQQR